MSYPQNPDFHLTHYGRRFYLLAITVEARKYLAENFPQIPNPQQTVIVGEAFALDFLEKAYWKNFQVLVAHEPNPNPRAAVQS